MNRIYRQSPVEFDCRPVERSNVEGWSVAEAFESQGEGPWLIDLSYLQRWDFQHVELDAQSPFGLMMPKFPGHVLLQDGFLISRMNGMQASICRLGESGVAGHSAGPDLTDTTDAHCMLAVTGSGTPGVMEHVSNLDLFDPSRQMPFLTQGPVLHIPSQVVTLGSDCVLMTLSRGYGQSFAESMLHAAEPCALVPGGTGCLPARIFG